MFAVDTREGDAKAYANTASGTQRRQCGITPGSETPLSLEGLTFIEILALSFGYKPLQGNMPDDCPQTHAHHGFSLFLMKCSCNKRALWIMTHDFPEIVGQGRGFGKCLNLYV
jgi:hypothetical protein